jgi:GNAT superfamily N-acetyltransferase
MVDIRRLAPADWQTLRLVRLAALAESPHAFGSTYERETAFGEQDWLGRIQRSAWFVAAGPADTAEPVGVAGAFTPHDRPDGREVMSMWVAPERRGGKLADRLLSTVLGWARDEDAAEVTLWVADDNERARRFYLRYGFAPTGRRQPLWGHPGAGADEYRLPLSPPR